MTRLWLIFTLFVLIGPAGLAQEGDSLDPADDSSAISTLLSASDSTLAPSQASIDDSIRIAFPNVDPDTLSENQRLLTEHEARLHFRFKEQAEAEAALPGGFDYFDSLVAYYVSPRWNLREDVDRSFIHDAGDYLKSEPAYLVHEPQMLPFRKTVQPHGLAGDRLGLIVGESPVTFLEHIVEPDGLTDLNDLPTALDDQVAVLPGPVGLIFGAVPSVATLLTRPEKPEAHEPRSAFVVDKGGDGFSYTRGKYSRAFKDGRAIDLSIGYRTSDGPVLGRQDDAYHYTGDFRLPMGRSWQLRASGRLYNRHGDYSVRPAQASPLLERDRFEGAASVSLSRQNANRTGSVTVSYRYLDQSSTLTRAYQSNLTQDGHGLTFSRQWLAGGMALSAEASADYLNYNNWHGDYSRYWGTARFTLATLSRPWGMALELRDVYMETYKSLPAVSILLRRESESVHFLLSAGYAEKAPALNDLHLPHQTASIYGNSGLINYADGGNAGLQSEKQLIGSGELTLGGTSNSLTLSVTGGQISDGIDWRYLKAGDLTVFSPVNSDSRFATASSVARVHLWDGLYLKTGGAYHHLDYDLWETRPYSPEYEAFAGGELHIFWSQKLIDLYAYGEVTYVGPYDGYVETGLGETFVVNTSLGFRMGKFRFHWVVQNSLLNDFNTRDYFPIVGRYSSYGFVWDFFD